MTEALAVREPIAVTNEQMTIAKNTVAKDLDSDQFAVYLYNCQRQGIHPLDGLLVPIVRTDDGKKKLTFVTTVDLLRSRAADSGEYAGVEDSVFEYQDNKPIAATVTVWRFVQGQKCSFTATARYDEYLPGEKQGFMWKSKPHVMLGKCAEGLALRKAFPKQLAGLYLEEEFQKDNSPTKPAKVAPKPVGDAKCADCGAVGGHLPKCPKRATPAQPAAPPIATENVMCGWCGQVNGHTAECKHATGASEAPTASNPGEVSLMIRTVEKKLKKADKNGIQEPYVVLGVTDTDENDWDLLVWHKSMHEYLLKAQGEILVCEYSSRKSGDRTYCSLERIASLGGFIFVDGKPSGEDREPF